MKPFKIILTCVIVVLLLVTSVFSILTFVKLNRQDVEDQKIPTKTYNVSDVKGPQDYVVNGTTTSKDTATGTTASTTTSNVNDSKNEDGNQSTEVLYQDNNITVTYRGLKTGAEELTYLIKIENKTSRTLNVVTDNVHIDGKRVYISGLTCENLLPESSQEEDFVVKTCDGSQNHNIEREFTFTLKLSNSKSYLDLYETKVITLKV